MTKIDAEKNQIVLGKEGSQYADHLIASDLNFIMFDTLEHEMLVTAKVRYQAQPAVAKLIPLPNHTVCVEFAEAQRSITPGQAVVFYDGDIVVGGGTIITT